MAANPTVQWNSSQAVNVFNTTGITRMVSELSSVQSMMNSLRTTQTELAAVNMAFLPANAITDVTAMNNRVKQLSDSLNQSIAEKEKLKRGGNLELISQANADIEKLRQQLGATVDLQNDMKKAMEAGDITAVQDAYNQLTSSVSDVETHIRDNSEAQMSFNDKVERGKALWKSLASLAKTYAIEIGKMAINGAMDEQQMKDRLSVQSGSDAAGSSVFNKVKESSLKSGVNVGEGIKSAATLMPMAQNTEQLDRMASLSMRMAVLDPNGGSADDAAAALKSAMQGDFGAMGEQYNIKPPEGFNMETFTATDDMNGFLDAMDRMLQRANMGQEAFEKMLDSPKKQVETLQNYMTASFASAGTGAIAALSPLFSLIIDAFESGKLQPYFDMLNVGLTLAGELLAGVGQAALWVMTTFTDYWPVIAGMLSAAALIYFPIMIEALWIMVAPLWAQAAAWMAINWPILLVIAAIGAIIFVLMQFGASAGQIIGFITGIFYSLFAFLQNGFGYLWNVILSFAEAIANFFISPLYSIRKLFYDLVSNIADYFGGMIKSLVSGLNWLLEKINKISGTSFKAIGTLDTSAVDKLKPTAIENAFDLSGYRMKQVDLGDAFKEGSEVGVSFTDKAGDKLKDLKLNNGESGLSGENESAQPPGSAFTSPSGGSTQSIANIDRVGEVGKVNDTVDISSEDLKTMRELAEMKNIQNFVSLQPTVSVQTGDINNGHDIDTIIGRIERSLNEQIVSSAEGVYG